MSRRLLAAALAVVAMLSLSSCLEYDEEMIINSDLSGTALVTLTLPDTLVSKYERLGIELDKEKIEKRLESVSGVSLASYQNSGGRQPKITMEFKFSSLEKLSEAIAANPPAAIWAGQFTVTKEGKDTKIDRKLGVGDPGNDLPPYNNVRYKTHFNGKIKSTNSPKFNSPANDVRYDWSLAKLVALQPTQSTTLTKGFPWLILLLVVAAVAAAAWYGWEYFGKKKRLSPLQTPTSGLVPPPPPTVVPEAAAPPPAPAPPPAASSPTPPPPQRPGPPQARRPGPPQPRPPGSPPQK
jgi:hypothetical protein